MFKKQKVKLKGPSRIAMFLLTCGAAMAAMLVWVLQSQGKLIDAFEVSGPFVAAWAAMIALSWLMLFLFRQATKVGGVPSALYIMFGVADFVLLAAAVALSVWALLPGLPAGSLFSGGEYGMQVIACSLLIVAGAAWDPLVAKYRKRPIKVKATPVPASQSSAVYDDMSDYGVAPPPPPTVLPDLGNLDDMGVEEFFGSRPNQG